MQKYFFLVEIGIEELPYKILKRLGYSFANQINDAFKKNGINCIEIHWFASPRHLAVKSKIQINNADIKYVKESEMHACNGLFFVHVQHKQDKTIINDMGKSYRHIKDILCDVVRLALSKLTYYGMMRWGEVSTPFIRPVHTVTILLDAFLIEGCFFGVHTNRVLYGHQFVKNNRIIIHHADEYPEILFRYGQVIVDYNRRKEIISLGVQRASEKIGGVISNKDNDLFDEITSLVEWPVVLVGTFDKKFLNLPSEIIDYVMRCDQKYFPVYNPINGSLLPYFIFVADVIADSYEKVIIGYENVIKPRLMDAEFFFNKDDQCRLDNYIFKLDSVLFHKNLGTLRDKSIRVATLSAWIADQIGIDAQQAKRAGYLCKCDLMSSMVFEFPLLQGIIGMYYALRDGESAEIALAQKEHYYPRFSTDILPTTIFSCTVAIADRIDTISGIFGIAELPTGDRDPFALKRSAFGILRILIQKKISLNLSILIQESVKLYGKNLLNVTVLQDIYAFMYKRLYSWYYMKNFAVNVIKSVLAIDYFNIVHVDARMRVVNDFFSFKKEENIKLCLVYKRILNIITNEQNFFIGDFQEILLKLPEEIQLFRQVFFLEKKIKDLLIKVAYDEILVLLMTLLDPINKFFDCVIVIDKNFSIRKNRVILLKKIKNLFLKIMDISFFL